METPWYSVANAGEVDSPALLFYPERIRQNIQRMITMAGDVNRLRPHIKTHKTAEILRLHLDQGITRFKCATIAEAEMAAACGAPDVLLAYQPVGPKVDRLLKLQATFPATGFSTIVDDSEAARALSDAAAKRNTRVEVLLDIDCGMGRSGVAPGPAALKLYRQVGEAPGLSAGGLHIYDGHLHQSSLAERRAACEAAFRPVLALAEELRKAGHPIQRMVVGGTPTFPILARRSDLECSPGTCVLWDQGYSVNLPDLDFLPAAVLLTRVISKPGSGRLCLDLGHKAVASENPPPRVQFLNLPDARSIMHSEEHLVIETAAADNLRVGTVLYAVPWHVCPTVALHGRAVVIEQGRAVGRWKIVARDRELTV